MSQFGIGNERVRELLGVQKSKFLYLAAILSALTWSCVFIAFDDALASDGAPLKRPEICNDIAGPEPSISFPHLVREAHVTVGQLVHAKKFPMGAYFDSDGDIRLSDGILIYIYGLPNLARGLGKIDTVVLSADDFSDVVPVSEDKALASTRDFLDLVERWAYSKPLTRDTGLVFWRIIGLRRSIFPESYPNRYSDLKRLVARTLCLSQKVAEESLENPAIRQLPINMADLATEARLAPPELYEWAIRQYFWFLKRTKGSLFDQFSVFGRLSSAAQSISNDKLERALIDWAKEKVLDEPLRDDRGNLARIFGLQDLIRSLDGLKRISREDMEFLFNAYQSTLKEVTIQPHEKSFITHFESRMASIQHRLNLPQQR